FFQAEDGIRDGHVTGVQTCALPIFVVVVPVTSARTDMSRLSLVKRCGSARPKLANAAAATTSCALQPQGRRTTMPVSRQMCAIRSEERRVGKGGRTRGSESRVK